MGNSGLGVSLYHTNGFLPSNCVIELMTQLEPFRKVFGETLPSLDGDRLFLLTHFREIDNQNQNLQWLMNTQGWQAMDAVKKGCVHMVESSS